MTIKHSLKNDRMPAFSIEMIIMKLLLCKNRRQRRRRECKSGVLINIHNLITLLYANWGGCRIIERGFQESWAHERSKNFERWRQRAMGVCNSLSWLKLSSLSCSSMQFFRLQQHISMQRTWQHIFVQQHANAGESEPVTGKERIHQETTSGSC